MRNGACFAAFVPAKASPNQSFGNPPRSVRNRGFSVTAGFFPACTGRHVSKTAGELTTGSLLSITTYTGWKPGRTASVVTETPFRECCVSGTWFASTTASTRWTAAESFAPSRVTAAGRKPGGAPDFPFSVHSKRLGVTPVDAGSRMGSAGRSVVRHAPRAPVGASGASMPKNQCPGMAGMAGIPGVFLIPSINVR